MGNDTGEKHQLSNEEVKPSKPATLRAVAGLKFVNDRLESQLDEVQVFDRQGAQIRRTQVGNVIRSFTSRAKRANGKWYFGSKYLVSGAA